MNFQYGVGAKIHSAASQIRAARRQLPPSAIDPSVKERSFDLCGRLAAPGWAAAPIASLDWGLDRSGSSVTRQFRSGLLGIANTYGSADTTASRPRARERNRVYPLAVPDSEVSAL